MIWFSVIYLRLVLKQGEMEFPILAGKRGFESLQMRLFRRFLFR